MFCVDHTGIEMRASIAQLLVVIGTRNTSTRTTAFASFAAPNCSTSDAGNRPNSTSPRSRPRAACQNGVAVNVSAHHARHRSNVRALTPNSERNSLARGGVTPCRIADTSTTIAPRYTRRPRNRTDGGVVRARQPSVAQHRLNRFSYARSRSAGPPRGLRG